jgi:ABC-type thiamin/hydroxymethylpyrimidine transport system permease subunit
MNALTIILGIWAMLALVAVLFIRGATARVERPVKEVPQSKGPSRFSIAE